jgi:hypothetical protein
MEGGAPAPHLLDEAAEGLTAKRISRQGRKRAGQPSLSMDARLEREASSILSSENPFVNPLA